MYFTTKNVRKEVPPTLVKGKGSPR